MITDCTYISGELLERVKHVEAVEIYDASRQGVIVSDDSQGHHVTVIVICRLCKINSKIILLFYFDCAEIIAYKNSPLLPVDKNVFPKK